MVMKLTLFFIGLTFSLMNTPELTAQPDRYDVTRLTKSMTLDANWDKPEWSGVKEIQVARTMGNVPEFVPTVRAKMMYDDQHVYIIFKVKDRFVRSKATEINGRIWEDSCVEFFFAPDVSNAMAYFNLEINCGGVPLFHFKDPAKPGAPLPSVGDIQKIEIAHSMPKVVEPEVKKETTFTVEYRIPVSMLERYASVQKPTKGVRWNGNFYKCADQTSNPHWLTWSKVENPTPNFHLPQFFGHLYFQ